MEVAARVGEVAQRDVWWLPVVGGGISEATALHMEDGRAGDIESWVAFGVPYADTSTLPHARVRRLSTRLVPGICHVGPPSVLACPLPGRLSPEDRVSVALVTALLCPQSCPRTADVQSVCARGGRGPRPALPRALGPLVLPECRRQPRLGDHGWGGHEKRAGTEGHQGAPETMSRWWLSLKATCCPLL